MKYLLVEVMERDISAPIFFDTHEEAHSEMCQCVADVLGVSKEEIVESYLSGDDYDDQTCVLENTAWTERHGNNFDWKIFKLNDAGEFFD